MDIRCVRLGELHEVANLHPELHEDRPDLTRPMLPDNPIHASPMFPYLTYALDGPKVIAHFMSFPDELIADGRQLPWAWNFGLLTDPAYRGRGLAQQLVELQLREFGKLNMIWGGVYSSAAAIRLYQRLNFSYPGHANRMFFIKSAQPFLREHLSKLVLPAATALANAALSMRHTLMGAGARRYELTAIEFADLADHLNLLSRRERFYWGTSAEWFNQRRAENDVLHLITRSGAARPSAFVITRNRMIQSRPLVERYSNFRMITAVEFGRLNAADDAPEAIASATIRLLDETNADVAEILTSSPTLEKAAGQLGFRTFGSGMSFKFMPPKGSPLLGVGTSIGDWHLTHYAGDAFAFE